MLVLVLVAAGSAGALVLHGRSSIAQSAIGGITERVGEPVILPDGESVELMNVLLVGSDDRSTLSEEQFAQIGVDRAPGRRADTIMLAQLEIGGEGAALLSFPRDLRVELCDGTTDKINAALAVGASSGQGPESCLVDAVRTLTGVDIHHYVEVDLNGFMQVVDVLGGVTLYLEEPMVDVKASLDVPAGCVTLTPDQALGFVRSRGYDDDFGRIARQQRFVREVVEELSRVGVLANPPKLYSLVDRAANAVRTDDGLGLAAMRDMASGLRRVNAAGLQGLTVPGHHTIIAGISFVELDAEAAAPLFADFRNGSAIRPPEPGAGEEPAPADQHVEAPPEHAPQAEAEPEPSFRGAAPAPDVEC
jgi:LCP family protein required for cell wall assembly